VLFGTSSFWEGVSIDGEKLSCVIIDRIPFQVPDDPVYEARCEVLKNDPEASWFNDLALPHATMRLKQGVGRLIRTSQDRGIVSILDTRLTAKRYGRAILECLPPMTIVRTINGISSIEAKLAQLGSDDSTFDSSVKSLLTKQSEIGQWSTK
jgi:ATP-dependent DNA helicase DinG